MVARRHFAYGLEKVVSEGGFSVTDILLRFKMNSFRSRAPWLWLSNSTGGCKALLAAGHLRAAFAEEPGCPVGWRWLQCRAALPWKGGKWGWVLSHLCFCRICLACRSSSCSIYRCTTIRSHSWSGWALLEPGAELNTKLLIFIFLGR